MFEQITLNNYSEYLQKSKYTPLKLVDNSSFQFHIILWKYLSSFKITFEWENILGDVINNNKDHDYNFYVATVIHLRSDFKKIKN